MVFVDTGTKVYGTYCSSGLLKQITLLSDYDIYTHILVWSRKKT